MSRIIQAAVIQRQWRRWKRDRETRRRAQEAEDARQKPIEALFIRFGDVTIEKTNRSPPEDAKNQRLHHPHHPHRHPQSDDPTSAIIAYEIELLHNTKSSASKDRLIHRLLQRVSFVFFAFLLLPPPSNVIPEPLTRWRCYHQGIPAQDVALVLRSPGPSGNGRYGEVPRHPPRLRGHLLGHAHRAPDGRPGSLETNGNPTSTHPPRSTIPFQCVSA